MEMWEDVTELSKDKIAIRLALSVQTKNSLTIIRQHVLEHVKMEDLRKYEGFNTLIAFMKLGKDDLDDNFEKYE